MSCHRFNPTRCHKSARFPVTGSIVYTTVHFPFFDSLSGGIPYAIFENCLIIIFPMDHAPVWNCAGYMHNSQDRPPGDAPDGLFVFCLMKIVPTPRTLRQISLLRIVTIRPQDGAPVCLYAGII